MITLNVNSLENAEIFWKELGLEEEIALNETYDPAPETLAISVETIDEIHDKIIELGLQLSPITKSADGRYLFSFIAPEGNTIIIIGEWVERPYTGEMRTEFFENIKDVLPLAPVRLSELTEGQFVLLDVSLVPGPEDLPNSFLATLTKRFTMLIQKIQTLIMSCKPFAKPTKLTLYQHL